MPLRHKSQASDVRNITALRKSTKTELGGFYDIVGKLKDYCDSERLRSASIGTTVKATVSLFSVGYRSLWWIYISALFHSLVSLHESLKHWHDQLARLRRRRLPILSRQISVQACKYRNTAAGSSTVIFTGLSSRIVDFHAELSRFWSEPLGLDQRGHFKRSRLLGELSFKFGWRSLAKC